MSHLHIKHVEPDSIVVTLDDEELVDCTFNEIDAILHALNDKLGLGLYITDSYEDGSEESDDEE